MQDFFLDYNDIRNHGERRMVGFLLTVFVILTLIVQGILIPSWYSISFLHAVIFVVQLVLLVIFVLEWRGISFGRLWGRSFLHITEDEIVQKEWFAPKVDRIAWQNVALIEKRKNQVLVLGYNDKIVRINTKYWTPADFNEFSTFMCCLAQGNDVQVEDDSGN